MKAILLGAIQGVSEFLPISSTGHLIIAEHALGISQEKYGLSFDAALHMGTLVAVLWFFRKDWIQITASSKDFLFNGIKRLMSSSGPLRLSEASLTRGSTKSTDSRFRGNDIFPQLPFLLLVGTIPGVLLGLLFEDYIDTIFRSPQLVGITLILFSFVLIYVEKVSKKTANAQKLKWLDSLIIGIAQSIALIPGVSRSGITIAAGMWRGLTRTDAARFAFLLSAPIIAGAGGMKLVKTIGLFVDGSLTTADMTFFATGMISAGIFGYATIKYFLEFLGKHSLYPFIIYRIIVGTIVFFLF